ncbi:MAG: STAS domain-containing protein [Acidobacteriota bacterium]|jgi:anti-sigma B factor antagonist
MQLTCEPIPDMPSGLTVRLSGNLEVDGATRLWEELTTGMAKDSRFFIFDLTDVPIVTSAGIGILVRFLVRLRSSGGAVAIVGCSEKIEEVFSIVMLTEILQVCGSEEEARERLRTIASG